MRLISLDTETTGSAPASGDRCVEVGLVEIIDGALTGRTYQTYLNPERPVAWQAQRVHGLTDRFLADKPLLHEVAAELLDFIGDAPCVAHGARFDRDMLLYDFRHAGLSVPRLTFYDSLPLARAHVRAPNHKLDTLGRTLGLIDQDRGLHGALEDAEILARVICRIAEGRPDALQSWLRGANALSPLPKGWDGGLAPSQRVGVPRTITPAREAVRSPVPGQVPAPEATSALPGEEAAEADRVANLVRMALEGSPDLPLFSDRLTRAGILIRPVLNGVMALHGVRFSTPKASFTGGAMGLTGSALERSGVRYLHPDHANLVRDLVSAHDAVMENILELKSLYKAVPSGSPARPGREVGVEARARLHEVILREIPGTRSIFELAERLERVGVVMESRIDTKRMRVSTVLFIGEGARLPGSRVGLRPRDRGPEFWSLDRHNPVRSAPDGRVVAGSPATTPGTPGPTRIGDGTNPGVAELVGAVNRGDRPISPRTVAEVRSGRDGWSRVQGPDLWDVLLTEHTEGEISDAVRGFSDLDIASTLRWMCRGLSPERSREVHLVRREVREQAGVVRQGEPSP